VTRTRIQPADELTETLLNKILKRGNFGNDRRLVVMINNLGATTAMELAIVARHAMTILGKKGYTVERLYAGTLLSSLDMAGISISVLGVNDASLRWLDAPTSAPAWPNASKQRPGKVEAQLAASAAGGRSSTATKNARTETGRKIKRAIKAACKALIEAEGELTEMDRIVGDGDLGASMKRAATVVQESVDTYPLDEAPATLKALGQTLRSALGGSSGPLYGVFFLRCGNVLEKSGLASLEQWANAVESGAQAISELGGAKPGDRTMLDALHSFVVALKNGPTNGPLEMLRTAVEAAKGGAEATAQMTPHLGRSSYLGNRVIGHADPGATAVAIWLGSAVEALFAGEKQRRATSGTGD
jgi:dihydroxyacetone kinase